MRALVHEKEKAILLRKQGMSYRDILKRVPVAKSSLSKWLINLPLTALEKQSIKYRRDSNISKGRIRAASALRERRLEREKVIFQTAKLEFGKFVHDPFFLLGIALYWGEGSKQGNSWAFTNSDDEMIALMITWTEKFFKIRRADVTARLQIHKPYADEHNEMLWSRRIGIPLSSFKKTSYKLSKLTHKKKVNYKGCIRIHLGPIAYFKKMQFWQQMTVDYYRKTM